MEVYNGEPPPALVKGYGGVRHSENGLSIDHDREIRTECVTSSNEDEEEEDTEQLSVGQPSGHGHSSYKCQIVNEKGCISMENGHVPPSVIPRHNENVYEFDPTNDEDDCVLPGTTSASDSGISDDRLNNSYASGNLRINDRLESTDSSGHPESTELDYEQDVDCSDAGDCTNDSFQGEPQAEYSDSISDNYDLSVIQRRGRGRPRGSRNGSGMGRGRGRGFKFQKMADDRSCSSYDLRNIPDPFNTQRRGRPRSRFIVDLGEQNHDAWTKAKEEFSTSDAELTTLLLSLLESKRDCSGSTSESDTMLGLVNAEFNKWKDKFSSHLSLLSHYASIHNTNCCTCLGLKKKKIVSTGTGKRGRPRKYPPPVGYGPGMQHPGRVNDDGSIFEPQVILKDGMVVKHEPGENKQGMMQENGPHSEHGGMQSPFPNRPLTAEELEKRREYYNNHKNKVKYVCHFCQVHFYHKPNFDYHISKLESNGKCKIYEKINNLYICETCGEGFSWREKLEKHLRLAETHGTHNQKELLTYGDFQCGICGKTFNKRTTYLQHLQWHEGKEDLPCVICGTTFKQTALRNHLMDVHSNDSLPCCYCGKLFTSRKYLEKHELIHQTNTFPCPECGKTFLQKVEMQMHLRAHSADREYPCDQCGQNFSQRTGLCPHLRKHFDYGVECDVCGQCFATEYNVKVHKRKIHNMQVDLLPDVSDQPEYMGSHHMVSAHMGTEEDKERGYNPNVKSMLGIPSMEGSVNLTMKQEGGDPEHMDEGSSIHSSTPLHLDSMRHMVDRRDGPHPDHMRIPEAHSMSAVEDHLQMPQDLTRMGNQNHMSDVSGRMSAAPQSLVVDPRVPSADSPGSRMADTPGSHLTAENLGRMAAMENFGRMTGTPGGYLAEHLRRMAENQSRVSEASYDERDYGRLGDNLRSMSRGSAGGLGENLSHMGVIRPPTQTPSSTPQWPPHMQNHGGALDSMNQPPQPSQPALYTLPFWHYDPSLRQYHH